MTRSFLFAIAIATMFSNQAGADETNIYNALHKIANSEDGEVIAEGILAVGKKIIEMDVDETIAFRTSLSLLAVSGLAAKGSSEREMVDILERETATHLRRLCSIDKSPETISKVNLTLGRPYRCRVK